MWRSLIFAAVGLGLPACTAQPPAPDAGPPPVDAGVTPVRAPPPVRLAEPREFEQAALRLEVLVKPGASDPTNPWAMAHGMVAFGKQLVANDGRSAISAMLSFGQPTTIEGRSVLRFPERTADNIPVEPHRDLILKTLAEAGVQPKDKLELKGKKITFDSLTQGAEWAFKMPTSDDDWHHFAWSFNLFLNTQKDRITTASGPLELQALAKAGLLRLQEEQRFLETPHRANRPDLVQKRKQGIYGHPCGGLHLVQAVQKGVARFGDDTMKAQMRKQLDLVRFRWDAERRIYRYMIEKEPKYRWLLLVQEMKFHGHVLETFAFAREAGLIEADNEHRRFIQQVAADTIDAARELEQAYAAQEGLKKSAPQTYFDLIGDGCHAIRGLRRALVAFFPG